MRLDIVLTHKECDVERSCNFMVTAMCSLLPWLNRYYLSERFGDYQRFDISNMRKALLLLIGTFRKTEFSFLGKDITTMICKITWYMYSCFDRKEQEQVLQYCGFRGRIPNRYGQEKAHPSYIF